MNAWQIFIYVISLQLGLLALGLFFLRKHGIPYANKIFAVFLILLGFGLISLVHSSNTVLFPYELVPVALYGPLFYFYMRHLITWQKVKRSDWVHLVPVLLVLVVAVAQAIGHYSSGMELTYGLIFMEVLSKGVRIPIFLLLLGYAFFGQWRWLRNTNIGTPLFQWVKRLNLGFVLFVSAQMIAELWLFFATEQHMVVHLCLLVAITPFLVIWAYFSLAISGGVNNVVLCSPANGTESKTSGLPTNFAQELQVQLIALMENNKPYLNADLQLDDIAQMIDISRHHASQLINDYCHQNFYEFINRYRVEEAKKMLSDTDSDHGIEDVAFQCGFNNRVSFYRTFKKFEGLSPTEFRNELLVERK